MMPVDSPGICAGVKVVMSLPPEPDQPFNAQTEYFPRFNVTRRWLTNREWLPVRGGAVGRPVATPLSS
jgi:hypothetical protein